MSSEYRKPRKAEKFRSIHSRRMRTSVQTSSAQMKESVTHMCIFRASPGVRAETVLALDLLVG